MTPSPDLAPTARAELAARRKHWPAAVAAGEMTQGEADADITAWAAIAALLEHGVAETPQGWAVLIATAETAMARRKAQALECGLAGTERQRREQRFGQLWAIRRALEHAAWRAGFFGEAAA